MKASLKLSGALAMGVFLSACSKQTVNADSGNLPAPPPEGFYLQSSQMCGTEAPAAVPEDAIASSPIDLTALETAMKADGITGWIHGAAPQYGEYVFTYRQPKNFFKFVEMSLVASTPEIAKTLATVQRNDQVKIAGSFLKVPTAQKHIWVTAISMVKKFDNPRETDYEHNAKLPADLAEKSMIYGVVHAQAMDGGVLAIDYKDAVLPVFVDKAQQAQVATLYRGDVVRIKFSLRNNPQEPTHLDLASDDDALTVIDHIAWCDKKAATLSGELILFPKSPEITMDIFAMRVTDVNGLQRNFTLTSDFDKDEDMSVFVAIQAKAADVWKANESTAAQARNQLVNTKIYVTGDGVINEVSPNQANPQLYMPTPDSLSFAILP